MPYFKVKTRKSNIHHQASRSGRGIGVPTLSPRKRLGALPRQSFLSGDTGSPSSSTDVTASRLMQQTMTDDDIEYYQKTHNNPPYKVQKFYRRGGGGAPMLGAGKENKDTNMLREYIRNLLIEEKAKKVAEPKKEDEDEEPDVDEASTTANIAGYILPLGASNYPIKDRKEIWEPYAKAFANAKLYQ